MNRRSFGRIGEESAALYLEAHGYRICGREVHVGHDEIDLIAENDDYLVFVEVKTRRQVPDMPSPYGTPASAVDAKKQAALLRAAEGYLAVHPCTKFPRMDVIEVYVSPYSEAYTVLDVRHYENAVRKTGKFSRSRTHRQEVSDEIL